MTDHMTDHMVLTDPNPHPSRDDANITLPSSGEKYNAESSVFSRPELQS